MMDNIGRMRLHWLDYHNMAAGFRRRASDCSKLEDKRKTWLIRQARDAIQIAREHSRTARFYGHVLRKI